MRLGTFSPNFSSASSAAYAATSPREGNVATGGPSSAPSLRENASV